MLGQNRPAEWVLLHLPHDAADARALKTKLEPADAGEQGPDGPSPGHDGARGAGGEPRQAVEVERAAHRSGHPRAHGERRRGVLAASVAHPPAHRFGALRNNCVAEGAHAVDPTGKPINHLESTGGGAPPVLTKV